MKVFSAINQMGSATPLKKNLITSQKSNRLLRRKSGETPRRRKTQGNARQDTTEPAVTVGQDDLTCHPPHPIENVHLEELPKQILSLPKAQRMAEFFSLLGDPNRLRILSVLAQEELCVCDLAATLDMSESAVSHQLRTLRAMRLVSYQKRGRKVFYRLQDHHVLALYQSVAEHLDEID